MAWLASLLLPEQRKIDPARWVDSWLADEPVGSCDTCRCAMVVVATDGKPLVEEHGVVWFRARCIRCGVEATSMRGVLTKGQRLTYNAPLPLEPTG